MFSLGLIGKRLTHSFSAKYFREKYAPQFPLEYNLYEIENEKELESFLKNTRAGGLNVTVPYKQTILPFLDELTEEARAAGAVNCLVKTEGRWKGHNTDTEGFRRALLPYYDSSWTKALILGTGGSARAVALALQRFGLPFAMVSRRKKNIENFSVLLYDELTREIVQQCSLIIQCTPLGMFPEISSVPPFPSEYLDDRHLVIDLIYNPSETLFLKYCRGRKARTLNGLSMLYFQADESMDFWIQHLHHQNIKRMSHGGNW